ncbi:glycine zipper 2TM domain-containing protein [Sphingomonas sp. S2-65]|uniref:glycine zipper 2TM domain-containing protein n=1 Tax=Sphingomonas sp. S2-65 TaxID=2903960 RepID=UPI001F45E174|nr:glycine zipper 2TM domain-containing protein [Sphingomonas sp. S2-65]UYY58939.1 glycine zipper 2TM domain-containing protein [Sphingomonas sp. S2-65]
MKNTLFSALLAASVTLGGIAATPAAAQRYDGYGYQDRGYRDGYRGDRGDRGYRGYRGEYRGDRGYRQRYGYRRCSSGTTGTILGAVAGGLLGGEIGRGNSYRGRSTTGTILGAGAGALLGREVDGGNCRR